jgi:hypothetical protein
VIHKGSLKLFVVSVVALAVLSLSTAALASAGLTGAGSTVAAAAMPNWTNGFLIKEGIAVTYSSVGGEPGLQKLDARSTDFAAADAPLFNGKITLPGKRYVDWGLQDPENMPIEEVRELREEIAGRVEGLIAELDSSAAGGTP